MRQREHAKFAAEELAVVLSNYDLGVMESVTEFAKGSRRSPKVGIVCQKGKFLLKRRSRARAHPDRVRFAHRVQRHLVQSGFPLAKLIETREGGQTMVQIRDQIYELFEYIAGHPYERTVEEAHSAGSVLARFHKATADFVLEPSVSSPHGDYHDATGLRTGLWRIAATLNSHDSFVGNEADLEPLIRHLLGTYDRAAGTANEAGLPDWPVQVVHSDYHPGNLLFKRQQVVAVIDFDSARRSRRVIDVANGVLQFSIIAGGEPGSWPEHVDEERFHGFLAGYETVSSLSTEERRCVPHLMAEALIAECVPPISETGSMGRYAGFRVLQMVRRKVSWLDDNGERLIHNHRG